MPEDRLSQLRKAYAEDDYLALDPPGLGPLRCSPRLPSSPTRRPGGRCLWPSASR